MGMIGDLWVKIGAKTDDFNRGLDGVTSKTSKFGSTLDNIGSKLVGVFAIGTIVSFFKSAISGYNEVAQAQAKLNAVLQNTGEVTGVTASMVKRLSNELKSNTLFSGTAIINASAILATFDRVGSDIFPKVIKQAANMAQVFGMDLDSAVRTVGKAMQSPAHGMVQLQRVIGRLTDEQTASIKRFIEHGDIAKAQGVILDALAQKFDGAAEAAAKAGTGPVMMLWKNIKYLSKEIGGVIIESRLWIDTINALSVSLRYLANTVQDDTLSKWDKFWKMMQGGNIGRKMINMAESDAKAYAHMQSMAETEKRIDEINKLEKEYLSETFTPQKKLDSAAQYKSAIEALKLKILECKAAEKNLTGEEFIEAEKNTQEAQKALEDYIKAHEKLIRSKEKIAMMEGSGGGFAWGTGATKAGEKTTVENGKFKANGQPGTAGLVTDPSKFWTGSEAAKWQQLEAQAELRALNRVAQFNEDLNNLIKQGLSEAAASFGEGIGNLMTGDVDIKGFGQNLLKAVAQFMIQFGKLVVAFGITKLGLDTAIKTPGGAAVAIAAGVALIAIGQAISNLSAKGYDNSSSGGGSSGYLSGSGNSYGSQANSTSTTDNKVVFELQGTKLVGVLNNTMRRASITG